MNEKRDWLIGYSQSLFGINAILFMRKRLIVGTITRTAALKSGEITSCIQMEGCLTKEADPYRSWCHGHPYALESLPADIQNNYTVSDCLPLPFQQCCR